MEEGNKKSHGSINSISIGQKIKALRVKRGMSQSDLSELIDKSPTYISYIENGVKSMSLETFVSIANALGCSADELLADNIQYEKRYVTAAPVCLLRDGTGRRQSSVPASSRCGSRSGENRSLQRAVRSRSSSAQ